MLTTSPRELPSLLSNSRLGSLSVSAALSQILPASVEVLRAVGEVAQAAELVADMRAIVSDALHALVGFAAGSHLLATGDASGALRELRGPFRMWASLCAPYEAARCRLLIGRALRVLDDEESAVAELSGARRAFAELGAAPAEHEAGQLLHAAAPGGLTAREIGAATGRGWEDQPRDRRDAGAQGEDGLPAT